MRLVLAAVVAWAGVVSGQQQQQQALPDARPAPALRSFRSAAIDKTIEQLQPLLKTADLATMLANTWPNTLDTTVYAFDDDSERRPDSFIITGDIEAMWLRDSQNQLQAYLPYVSEDAKLERLVAGTINRQAASILLDPYANAFNYNSSTATGQDHQSDIRKPKMQPAVFEGKYELDSIMSFLKLGYWYYRQVGAGGFGKYIDASPAGAWARAVGSVVDVVMRMQTVSGQEPSADMPYTFQRDTATATDTLSMQGRGPPTNPAAGLSRQLFRPSDDAVTLGLNVPGNAMACVELTHSLELVGALGGEQQLGSLRDKLAAAQASLCSALKAVVSATAQQQQQQPLPYEIDGYGGAVFMDDANVPSLLSLPLLGYMSASDPANIATRQAVWSSRNPYFYKGQAGEGVGGPHVGPDMAWPMAVAVRAMTSTDEGEIAACLDQLLATTAGTGLMHESFNVHDATKFTRKWFAWANGVFAELVLQLVHTHPLLVLKSADVVAQAQALVKVPVSLLVQRDRPVAELFL